MDRQLPKIVPLGDVADVEAYVAAVVDRHWPGIPADEREVKIAEGLEIVCREDRALGEGESLSRRLAVCLYLAAEQKRSATRVRGLARAVDRL